MKKLMIAACAIACAAAAQAATVKWQSSSMYEAGANGAFNTEAKLGVKGSASAAAAGQLYYISAAEYATWAETLTKATTLAAQQTAMLSLADGLKGGTIGTGAVDGGSATVSKNAINITDPKSYTGMSKESPITAYAAVIYSYNDGKADWTIANVGSVYMDADQASSLTQLGGYFAGDTTGTAIQGWATQAVPEPTSGLLLLLGVAGLALRRRRA